MKFEMFKQVINLETGEVIDNSVIDCYGGGKGGTIYVPPEPQPIIQPTPAVEEASVEMDDEEEERTKTNKGDLKVPLAVSERAGLNSGNSPSGLSV